MAKIFIEIFLVLQIVKIFASAENYDKIRDFILLLFFYLFYSFALTLILSVLTISISFILFINLYEPRH